MRFSVYHKSKTNLVSGEYANVKYVDVDTEVYKQLKDPYSKKTHHCHFLQRKIIKNKRERGNSNQHSQYANVYVLQSGYILGTTTCVLHFHY